jgi:hypothetical protein
MFKRIGHGGTDFLCLSLHLVGGCKKLLLIIEIYTDITFIISHFATRQKEIGRFKFTM